MTIGHVCRAALGALLLSTAQPALAAAQQEGTGAQLNYEGADLAQVARDVAFRTGRIFVIDPRLSGRVNIVSPPGVSLSPDEVWEVFLATLQVNGFAAVPIGDREYRIVPSGQAIRGGSEANQTGGSTVTRVVPLQYVSAATAASNLRGLTSENGLVLPIVESNSLVIVDSASNVARLMSIIDRFDMDDSIVRTVPLENAAASQVVSTLREVIASRSGADQANAVSIVPVTSSNSVVLKGKPADVQRLMPIVKELDTEGRSDASLDVIYLNHASAEDLVPIIQQLLDEVSTVEGGEGRPTPRGKTSVAFHNPTNALIINASPEKQRIIRGIVDQLDIRRPQVLIEAVVVRISNSVARDLGVQYVSGGGDLPISASTFSSNSPNVISAAGAAMFLDQDQSGDTRTTTVTAADGTTTTTEETIYDSNDPTTTIAGQLVEAAVGELLSYNGFVLGAGGDDGNGGVYGVLLSAIQSDSQSSVLQVPSTVLLDNEEGKLQVGQEIPIVTGEAVGSDFQGGFRQVERKDVGTILNVTPQINAGNTVRLDINLELSSIGGSSAFSQEIITNKSLVETKALAEDGQTLVIGGLIDNTRVDTENKVPFLGDIPVMGNLFKGQSRSEEKSTLMVFIRPTILRDDLAADSVTARKYDYARQQQLRRSKDGKARLDEVMRDYIGHDIGYAPAPQGDAGEPGTRIEGRDGTSGDDTASE